jgi:DNA-binding IclR family transcriptional regulator
MNLSASALAAPIYTPTGVTSSVGVIAPQQRFDDAKEATMADAVVAAASELGRRLGDPVAGLRGLTGATS